MMREALVEGENFGWCLTLFEKKRSCNCAVTLAEVSVQCEIKPADAAVLRAFRACKHYDAVHVEGQEHISCQTTLSSHDFKETH